MIINSIYSLILIWGPGCQSRNNQQIDSPPAVVWSHANDILRLEPDSGLLRLSQNDGTLVFRLVVDNAGVLKRIKPLGSLHDYDQLVIGLLKKTPFEPASFGSNKIRSVLMFEIRHRDNGPLEYMFYELSDNKEKGEWHAFHIISHP